MLTLVIGLVLAAVQAPAPGAGLAFRPPAGWQPRNPSSGMRVAEFVLPRASGDPADAELVIYYFGGSGGSIEANIQRWLGQMQQPDGRAPSEVAKRTSAMVNGLKVTSLDITGTYVAEMRPGSSDRHNSPGFRMRTAVIETPRGPYFLKLVGPEQTIARWDTSFAEFMASVRFAQ